MRSDTHVSGRTLGGARGASSTLIAMARIESSSLPNGLPLHRVELPTRSLTALVAFDAGARTERPEENGMAHFLEHLVFKGGVKYDDYRKVNQTAETMGCAVGTVKSQVSAGLAKLRQRLGDDVDLVPPHPKPDQKKVTR